MCTLALWYRVFPSLPIVVAANRDENPQRAWSDPAPWPDESPTLLAGRDLVGGGTWLAVKGGLFCGITNRWGEANDPSRRSRGLIVLDAVRAGNAAGAAKVTTDLAADAANAFGMLIAGGSYAFRIDHARGTVVTPLLPGSVTVLANWPASERRMRTDRAEALAREVPTDSFDAALPSLKRLVADHEGAEIVGQAICTHGDRYATVSSTLLAVDERGRLRRWLDTRGNPCVNPWRERVADEE
jgi:uncharacterized protein with NRDE domain